MNISTNGVNFIKGWEGFSSVPYLDVARIPTIGFGATYYPMTGKKVAMKDKAITLEQGLDLLKVQLNPYVAAVNRYTQVPLTQNQFDALVSFCYNVGIGALQKSTLLKKLNKLDYTGASKEFLKWNIAGGKIVRGLTNRRTKEAALFSTP